MRPYWLLGLKNDSLHVWDSQRGERTEVYDLGGFSLFASDGPQQRVFFLSKARELVSFLPQGWTNAHQDSAEGEGRRPGSVL